MVLERFLFSNIWMIGLIGLIFGIKKLLRSRLPLRFQYICWYALPISFLISLLPDRWLRSCMDAVAIHRQAFSFSGQTFLLAPLPHSNEWLNDTVELTVTHQTQVLPNVLLLLWLTGFLVVIAAYGCSAHRLDRIGRSGTEPDEKVIAVFRACLSRVSVTGRIILRQTDLVDTPFSFGFFPCILLPERRVSQLTQQKLEHILLHELIHIRHGDVFTNHLFCLFQALYWHNPIVWAAMEQMRRDREAYCDWEVLNALPSQQDRLDYGQTLLSFAAKPRPFFHTANGLCQSKSQLKFRLENILNYRPETGSRRLLGRCAALVLALLCCAQFSVLAMSQERSEQIYTPSEDLKITEADFSDLFDGAQGCAVIYDRNANVCTAYNSSQITHRFPPCSTSKIYSALYALESNSITPLKNLLRWDGTQYPYPAWNQDQNLASAMGNSVNWYFQTLDQMAGIGDLTDFYQSIHYGNAYLGTDPASYWNGTALLISPLEQVQLLARLYGNDYGFEPENVSAVFQAIQLYSDGQATLYGKTGTGRYKNENVAGWFIGIVETMDNVHCFAVYLNADQNADGAAAFKIAASILSRMGIPAPIP